MKNIFLTTINLLFLWGCSTNNNNGNTTLIPNTPTNLSASVISTTQVNLQWTDNSNNESGYKVQRKTIGGNFTDIASAGIDIVSYSDFGVAPNTTYTYRVYAYNSAGNSIQYSNEVTINTNQMIGKYFWEVWSFNGTNQSLSSCRRQSYIIFNSDGTFSRRGWDFTSSCILTDIDDGIYVYNSQSSILQLIFTDNETWHNVQIVGNKIKYTWDENLDGSDEHYIEYLKQ